MARISPAELSLIERKLRLPGVDIIQKIAASLEVSTSYLLGEEDSEVALPQALARQALKIFLRDSEVSQRNRRYLERISRLSSAPQTVRGWRDLLCNVAIYERQARMQGTESPRLGRRRRVLAGESVAARRRDETLSLRVESNQSASTS